MGTTDATMEYRGEIIRVSNISWSEERKCCNAYVQNTGNWAYGIEEVRAQVDKAKAEIDVMADALLKFQGALQAMGFEVEAE